MSHMTVNQRNQYDRAEFSAATTGGEASPRSLAIFTAIAAVVLGGLAYATVTVIDGWAQAIVLGFILLTAVGTIIAVSPTRKA